MENDVNLLETMIIDAEKQSNLYKPGYFWAAASKVSARKMKEQGITQFRGRSGLVGQGFTDNIVIDPSIIWEVGRLKRFLKPIVDTSLFRKFIIEDFTTRINKWYKKSNLYEDYFL